MISPKKEVIFIEFYKKRWYKEGIIAAVYNFMNNIKTQQKGFTIVELAVTLVVIGVIVLMAMGAYKGIRGSMVHIQWQALMNDAYSTLMKYAYDEGYLPKNQADFDNVFIKKVDDYSYGGTVGYVNVDPAVTNDSLSIIKKLCGLTNNDISNSNHVVFTLRELSRGNRAGKLADKDVTLADVQAALKCLPATTLSISDPKLPISYPDKDYRTSVYAYGGIPFAGNTYEWCVEVPPLKDLKCAASKATKPVDLVLFFNELQTSVGTPVPFSTNCLGVSGWARTSQFNLVFFRDDKRRYLGADSIPFKVYARDAGGTYYSRSFDFVNFGLYVPLVKNGECNF